MRDPGPDGPSYVGLEWNAEVVANSLRQHVINHPDGAFPQRPIDVTSKVTDIAGQISFNVIYHAKDGKHYPYRVTVAPL